MKNKDGVFLRLKHLFHVTMITLEKSSMHPKIRRIIFKWSLALIITALEKVILSKM